MYFAGAKPAGLEATPESRPVRRHSVIPPFGVRQPGFTTVFLAAITRA